MLLKTMLLKNPQGSTLIEFAFASIIFLAFLFGLLAVTMWGIAGLFVQEAAFRASEQYAVSMDVAAAQEEAMTTLGRWAYLFVDPGSVSVNVRREEDKAVAEVRAKPRVQRLYLYQMPELIKRASCTLEYRFRKPEEFSK